MIELDVIKTRSGRVLIAHDYLDVSEREPLTLDEGLDLFTRPPLDRVGIDCDLKVAAGEAELVAALRERNLTSRAMVSTMELSSLRTIGELDPGLRRGWTYPRVERDWANMRWAAPGVAVALAVMGLRLPRIVRRMVPELGVDEIWAYHRLVSTRLVGAAESVGAEVVAWTVDDPERITRLRKMGVHGICTNDPRLFDRL